MNADDAESAVADEAKVGRSCDCEFVGIKGRKGERIACEPACALSHRVSSQSRESCGKWGRAGENGPGCTDSALLRRRAMRRRDRSDHPSLAVPIDSLRATASFERESRFNSPAGHFSHQTAPCLAIRDAYSHSYTLFIPSDFYIHSS